VKRLLAKQALLLAAALASIPAAAQGSHTLANARLRVTISDGGRLESIENRIAAEVYGLRSDWFAVETGAGVFSNRTVGPAGVRDTGQRVEFRYEFGPARVTLVYSLGPENAFFRRQVTIANSAPLRLRRVVLGNTVFAQPAGDVVHYVTFIAAPTVEFIRYPKGGLFTGIENPFFETELTAAGVTLGFEPGLILKAGEGYSSEPQFFGVYKSSGVTIEDSGRDFRYNANGSGYKPIDRNEMRAMRAFALDYLSPAQKTFLNINYQFFHPLPQMPRAEKDKRYFTKTIDVFSGIGGDMIIFKPLHPYRKPDAGRPYWDVVPDDPGQTARQISDYARSKGVSYGFYMGCAAHGTEGNAAGLPFRPDRPEWKKSDAAGRRAPDNCLASDGFYEWWFEVQNRTIRKYGLSNWSWDPSLGSGMNCYDESHGHIAGKGAYKGWRRAIELMGRLKAANPGLFIQGFYGTKQFGLWGLRHVDQHEVYNEQTIIVSTRHNQISDDRQNADGLRFQNNWSMRFRFTPAAIGHALVHRISEGGFDPDLTRAWDYAGWKYGVMSALAVAGAVMPTILPYESGLVPGYTGFYRKWLRWAKDNFEYVNYTEPFGEQVEPGAVDGYARIKGDHGFVFLFNGNPRPSEIVFEVGDEINLQAGGSYEFVELYPSEKRRRVLDANGKSVFPRGAKARIAVPANSCFLFELRRAAREDVPVLLGADGALRFGDGGLEITGVSGKPGERIPMRVRLPGPGGVKSVTVNGVPREFAWSGNEISLDARFAGERFVRELDSWMQAGGRLFEFPNRTKSQGLTVTTSFVIHRDVARLLEQARPDNFAVMGAKIASWQQAGRTGQPSFQNQYSYHNFICERPERLWLIVPFLERTEVALRLNGQVVAPMWDRPSTSAFADVTDLVRYGAENRLELRLGEMAADAFLGPYLLYPEEAASNQVMAGPGSAERQTVYRRTLGPALRARYRPGAGPRVTEAGMTAHVTLTAKAELRVKLDLPPERIQRVMYFESGFPWMGQHPLRYSREGRYWTAEVTPGDRARIQENEYIYVWAEGTDGLRSEYYPVRAGWDFLP
jgi:hypothetical protein